jgi:hypothetical protein
LPVQSDGFNKWHENRILDALRRYLLKLARQRAKDR